MSDDTKTASPTNPDKPGASRLRRLLGARAALVIALGLLGLVALGCDDDSPPEVATAGGDEQPGDEQPAGEQAAGDVPEWDATHDDLGVSPAEFRQRWNDAIADIGAGAPLGEPTEAAPGFRDLPTRQYPIEGISSAEIVLTPEEDLVVKMRAANIRPVGTQQRLDLVAIINAAVSATTDLSVEQARQRLAADLGLAGEAAVGEHHSATTDIDGVTVGVFAAHGTWEFFIEKKLP